MKAFATAARIWTITIHFFTWVALAGGHTRHCQVKHFCSKSKILGCRHSSVDLSAPSFLPPCVRIPSTLYQFKLWHYEKTKINRKRGRDWPICLKKVKKITSKLNLKKLVVYALLKSYKFWTVLSLWVSFKTLVQSLPNSQLAGVHEPSLLLHRGRLHGRLRRRPVHDTEEGTPWFQSRYKNWSSPAVDVIKLFWRKSAKSRFSPKLKQQE